VTQTCGPGNTASWTNTGTLIFSDTASQSSVNLCGTFTNAASGTVTRSVGGTDNLTAGHLSNAGLITTPLGRLNLSSGAGSFTGGSVTAAPGKIVLAGTFTATGAATIGDNVWVYANSGSTLTGTIVIPAGATLHVGFDPNSNTNINGVLGTISGSVGGAGTLSVAGRFFANTGNVATAVVAADLNVAVVSIEDYVSLAMKPDGTPTEIASGTTVTVAGRVTLTGSTTVVNNGSINITVGTHILNGQSINGGLYASSCSGAAGPSLTNAGTMTFNTSGGASVSVCSLTNSGTVAHPGVARDTLTATQLTTTGAVTVSAGTLVWSLGTGLINDGSVAGGNGQLIMTSGTTTATADATVGDNVWVVGGATLTGTTVIPSGATVHIGYNADNPVNVDGPAGTIAGTVNGPGLLNVNGHFFPSCGTCTTGNTATAVIAADLNVATVVLGDYATFATKPDATPTRIGNGAAVVANGDVRIATSTAVINNGTVEVAVGTHMVNGLSVQGGIASPLPCVVSDTSSWVNNGTVLMSDNTGSARFAVCGSFTNAATGTVRRTGNSKNTLSSPQLTNVGLVTSTAGILIWSSPNGLFAGGLVVGTTGQIHIVGTTTATADANVGNNVWVLGGGTLTGTIVIPAGATVHVGYNAANPTDVNGISGTVSGTVTGAGTLSAIGQVFSHFPNGENTATAMVAADLNVANVSLADFTILGTKPDGTPTSIGTGAVVTLVKTPTLAPGLQLHNLGTIDFGTNPYFNCSTCTLINEPDGELRLHNPDGSFAHGFIINSGTFDNEGLITLTGYLPGTWVVFGPNVTLVGAGAGQAKFDDLAEPTWIANLKSDPTVQLIANALTQAGLTNLGRNALLYALANLSGIGAGQCTSVNAGIGVAGASVGVCVVVDRDGNEVVVLNVSGGLGGGVSWPSSGPWNVQNLLGPSVSLDAGAQALWRAGAGGRSFDIQNDIDGTAWCQNGTLVSPGFVGGTGQHCWGPVNNTPFELNSLSFTEHGVHSGYFGVVVGTPTVAAGVMLSYSVTISCAQWFSVTLQACPPVNKDLPEVIGMPAVGQTLTVSDGTWTLASTLTYSYKWLRCPSSTGSCSQISGANNKTYTVTTADRNSWVTAAVTATNSGGSSQTATAIRVGPVP
jgi:hypothetical protein